METEQQIHEQTAVEENKKSWDDLASFLASFEQESDIEKKIALAIQCMQSRLFSFASPKFREFWEVRKLCLPLFKENLSPKSRSDFWQQYVELAVEARRIKEILDEKSNFAYEQIDLALQSLAEELSLAETNIENIPAIEIPEAARTFHSKKEKYVFAQKNLQFFHTLATRLSALRKEIVKIDMKVRSKNKLFEKLSACGDQIFPKRKEWIRKVSEDFIADVTEFVQRNFQSETPPRGSLFALKEEVKALQSLAKILMMNTYAFTETRVKLSTCWDLLKEWDKKRKQELEEKKELFQKNLAEVFPKVEEFIATCSEELPFETIDLKYKELLQVLRSFEIDRTDRAALEEKIELAKRPHEEKKEKQRQEVLEKEKQAEANRIQKIQDLHKTLEALLEKAEQTNKEDFEAQKLAWEETYQKAQCSKSERILLDRLHKRLKDKMLDLKKSSLLKLSTGAQEDYKALCEVLEQKKERRQEIKEQLEMYRKILGSSNLDFERALSYQELMQIEKLSLAKITQAISEIEEKLEEVSS